MRFKLCSEVNCNTLIDNNKRYCDKHTRIKLAPFANAVRFNAALYNTVKWRKLRQRILKEHPYCSKCGIDNKLHIHHIIESKGNGDLFYDENNLTVLCESCHRIETAKEINKRVTVKSTSEKS